MKLYSNIIIVIVAIILIILSFKYGVSDREVQTTTEATITSTVPNEAVQSTSTTKETTAITTKPTTTQEVTQMENKSIVLTVNGKKIPVKWEDNETIAQLKEHLKANEISVPMSMYSNNEQVGPLGRSFISNDKRITTSCGDIVLYSSNQIVMFYAPNTWAYTRLGKMDLSNSEVVNLLSNGDVDIVLTLE